MTTLCNSVKNDDNFIGYFDIRNIQLHVFKKWNEI